MLLSARATASATQHISTSQVQAMIVLNEHGNLKLTRFAELLHVIPSSATRLCDRLVAAGLVVRETNLQDRREVILSLTSTGHRVLNEIRDYRLRALSEGLAHLDHDQRTTLMDGLDALRRVLAPELIEQSP